MSGRSLHTPQLITIARSQLPQYISGAFILDTLHVWSGQVDRLAIPGQLFVIEAMAAD